LTNLQTLDCSLSQISELELYDFKKAMPNCKVISLQNA